MIDDAVGAPDDDTTHIFRADTGAITNAFNFSAFDIDSSSITKVVVTFRSRRDINFAQIAARITVNSTVYIGSLQTQTDTYADYTEDWLTNPDTGLAWIEADVEGTGANPLQDFLFSSLQSDAGFGNPDAFITQGYITVDFTEAAAGGILARHPALRQPMIRR